MCEAFDSLSPEDQAIVLRGQQDHEREEQNGGPCLEAMAISEQESSERMRRPGIAADGAVYDRGNVACSHCGHRVLFAHIDRTGFAPGWCCHCVISYLRAQDEANGTAGVVERIAQRRKDIFEAEETTTNGSK